MKTSRVLLPILVLALLSLLLTCRMNGAFLGPANGTNDLLPVDQVLDVSRSYGGTFEYETLLPVRINLTVELFRPEGTAGLASAPASDQLIIATIVNSRGERIYSGKIPASGILDTVLSLPAAQEDAVLTLEAPGFEQRRVTIDNMVRYSEIRRVMSMRASGMSAKGAVLPDRDGDGIPDIYDAYPDDPDVAFTVRNPASGLLTVAFEDLYPTPGDADYNDFVAKYFIIENHKTEVIINPHEVIAEEKKEEIIQVMLGTVHGEFTATAKVAGYNHKFGIMMDFPSFTALRVRRVYYDAAGNQMTEETTNVADKAVIWLFENTKFAVGKTAVFDISFPKGVTRDDITPAPYDPVLYVLNTGKDIHLVGRDPLSGPVPGVTYMDSNGYPWGLLVPDDWQHPTETQYIGKAYPLFDAWRTSFGADFAYWYLYPASANTVPGNNPPYPVTGPASPPALIAGYNQAQTFTVSFNSPNGSRDPDGDAAHFVFSPIPAGLAPYFSLDDATGIVTFAAGVQEGSYPVYFWSEDEHGASTIAAPYKATFAFTP